MNSSRKGEIMKRSRTVWIKLIISVALVLTFATPTKGAGKDPAIIKIATTDGKQLTLTGPFYGYWIFKVNNLIFNFDKDTLKQFKRVTNEKFDITTQEGTIMQGIPQKPDGFISGKGEWGEMKVAWNKINQLEIITQPISSSKDSSSQGKSKPQWNLSTEDGMSLDLTLLSSRPWKFDHQDFEIDIDIKYLMSLERMPNSSDYRIKGVDGSILIGSLREKNFEVSGTSYWGHVSLPISTLAAIVRTSATADPKTSAEADKPSPASILIISNAGASFKAWDVNPNSITFHDLSLKEIHWSNVKSAKRGDSGLQLTDAKGSSLDLNNGKLSGSFSLGHFFIPTKSINLIQSTLKPKALASAKNIIAKVTLLDGFILTVSNVDIDSQVDTHSAWLEGFIELKKNGLHYWLKEEVALKKGFQVVNGRLQTDVGLSVNDFDKPTWKLTLNTSLASYQCEAPAIQKLYPVPLSKSSPTKKTGSILVTIQSESKEPMQFKTSRIQFVNYPATAWTGSYYISSWPFQWWREDYIEVVPENDNVKMQINIDKLRNIAVTGNTYTRKLNFTSRNGNELMATHIWDDLNKDSKKGPSQWAKEKEGIVLDLIEKELYVFIPFMAISKIAIEYPH